LKDQKANTAIIASEQDKMYAQDHWGVIILTQAMDAAGKDGLIKHVLTGVNPLGTQVFSFKQPSAEELDHDYLWRINQRLPERGRIGIFNRSYYEDVLVVKVHNLIASSKLPDQLITDDIWDQRYRQIRDYERYLAENGFIIIKFFLNVSKEEQKERFLSRIDNQSKNWKFSTADVRERGHWDEYMDAYEKAIQNTATEDNPWYILPADRKWYARTLASEIIAKRISALGNKYPDVGEEKLAELEIARQQLEDE
jgi:PPK2 family polyphosphate:nucleotide phosphotransferase